MTRPLSTIRILAIAAAVIAFGCDRSTPAAAPSAPATQPKAAAPSGAATKPASPAGNTTAPAAAAAPAKPGWPTEEEAKAAIFKVEHDIYASETNKQVWHVKEMRHEVKSVKFAQETTQKQMRYGAQAQTVYPAKILYTRITEYTDKAAVVEEQGKDGVWFFYKDSFGDWICKYGNE